MTPTLLGRWQTRLLLLATVGSLVTLPLAIAFSTSTFFVTLAYVAGFGLAWDALYNYLQSFRWDRDWSALFQTIAGIVEGLFLILLIKTIGLPGLTQTIPVSQFALHYSLVWLSFFLVSQSLMRVLFPRWRFRGGQW